MRRLGLVAVVFLLGCGLDEEGLLDVLDSGPTDVALDVVKDVKEEPVVCADAGPASCTDAVAFRSPALFSPDAGAACPAGYDTHDLALSVPAAPTCTCQCADAGPPSCSTSLVSYHFGTAGFCNGGSGSYSLTGCTVTTQVTFTGESVQIDPPAVTGGCSGGTSLPPQASTSNVRLCTPQCASDESVCAAQGGLRACVVVSGNVASCPPSYSNGPFYIGANPTTTCDTCSCSETGDCSGSVDHLYGDTTCGAGDQGFAMDGQCHALAGGHIGAFQSAKIDPKITGAACKVTPGASHTTYGGNDFTVCCQ